MSNEQNEVEVIEEQQSTDRQLLQRIVEGALLAAAKPMTVKQLAELFDRHERPAADEIQAALEDIQADIQNRGFELKQVASGYRFQVVQDVSKWVAKMWDEKPQKYSRALLETLSLIAYRQPITRGDIEEIRGVAVSSHIIKTLMEREWIRVVGHKDVPGRPAMFATTRRFLDYFNLNNLDELPSLAEIRDLDSMNTELALEGADTPPVAEGESADGEAKTDTDPQTPTVDADSDDHLNSEGDDGADEVEPTQDESASEVDEQPGDVRAESVPVPQDTDDVDETVDPEQEPAAGEVDSNVEVDT